MTLKVKQKVLSYLWIGLEFFSTSSVAFMILHMYLLFILNSNQYMKNVFVSLFSFDSMLFIHVMIKHALNMLPEIVLEISRISKDYI